MLASGWLNSVTRHRWDTFDLHAIEALLDGVAVGTQNFANEEIMAPG